MKSKLLSRGALIVLFCLTTGLVFAQDAAEEPMAAIEPRAVVYGEVGGVELLLNVYEPALSDSPRAAVVLIHGGAGKYGERRELAEYASRLAAAGYVVFNIDYRLLQDDGNKRWPAQLEDAQLAVRWVRANAAQYHVDPDQICALGHSFGGQLAALLGERDTLFDTDLPLAMYSSKVACVIDIAGSVDPLRPFNDVRLQPIATALYGGTPNDARETYLSASALAQVDASTSPFLIFHGADDEVNPVEQSREMVDALHRAGVEVVYVEVPHATHLYWISPFEITGAWDLVAPEMLAFLGRHLHSPS
ncbi:MAG: alpha/beta fold hydrolase [Chloroflexi bacterium]|nr:alpha/beta fold hydrolase [Chloroflexota bacterium]